MLRFGVRRTATDLPAAPQRVIAFIEERLVFASRYLCASGLNSHLWRYVVAARFDNAPSTNARYSEQRDSHMSPSRGENRTHNNVRVRCRIADSILKQR